MPRKCNVRTAPHQVPRRTSAFRLTRSDPPPVHAAPLYLYAAVRRQDLDCSLLSPLLLPAAVIRSLAEKRRKCGERYLHQQGVPASHRR